MHAMCERAQRCHRRGNVPKNHPKSNADRSRNVAALRVQLPKAFCRLTPELSRPVAGRRTRASVAQSTRLPPRHGVGLNDLLGGKDAGEGETPASLPKIEAQALERAPVNFQSVASEAEDQMQLTNRRRMPLPKPASATHATCERAPRSNRRGNEPTNQPKSMQSEAAGTAEQPMQLPNAFLPPNA
jgi:hypothetical protein